MTGIEKLQLLVEKSCGNSVSMGDVSEIIYELGNLSRQAANKDCSNYYVRIKLDVIQDYLIKNGHSKDSTEMFKTMQSILKVFFDEVYQEYVEFAHDNVVKRFGPINEEEVNWRRDV